MKVHLIKAKTVRKYARKHSSSVSSFDEWIYKVKNADWDKPSEIMVTFPSADLLGKGSKRVVFDIGGNNFRIICAYKFGKTMVHLFVKWVGTHKEYDRICSNNRQYTIDKY